MSSTVALPEQFSFLEPYAAVWGDLHSQNERYLKRQALNYEELEAFHGAVRPARGGILLPRWVRS